MTRNAMNYSRSKLVAALAFALGATLAAPTAASAESPPPQQAGGHKFDAHTEDTTKPYPTESAEAAKAESDRRKEEASKANKADCEKAIKQPGASMMYSTESILAASDACCHQKNSKGAVTKRSKRSVGWIGTTLTCIKGPGESWLAALEYGCDGSYEELNADLNQSIGGGDNPMFAWNPEPMFPTDEDGQIDEEIGTAGWAVGVEYLGNAFSALTPESVDPFDFPWIDWSVIAYSGEPSTVSSWGVVEDETEIMDCLADPLGVCACDPSYPTLTCDGF